ncbi:MAG: group II truncated hemoglobin [Chloroherpetonaceae bacterium]
MTSLYEQLGGETKVRELVDIFYDVMDTDPRAKKIRDLHPKDLRVSREKLFMFLSGWLGGEQLYIKKYGHPRLRARHLPFPIGEEERDQWMLCMKEAMKKMTLPAELQETLEQAFFRTADFMRNQAD